MTTTTTTTEPAKAAEPIDVIGMACQDPACDFKPIKFQRRAPGPEDVLIDMVYCGVCHTDLHASADHLKGLGMATKYPCVTGHELAGVVTDVGPDVTKFQIGDHIGVGCMVDSCLDCKPCNEGHEQYCKKTNTSTYQGEDKFGRAAVWPKGSKTMGGYSTKMVVHQRFGIKIPKSYPLACAGPVMCAGVTMYEPLQTYNATTGTVVGIVGLGGLGTMGVKIAKELGCTVTAISRGPGKKGLALEAGASEHLDSKSIDAMTAKAGTFDLILDTIPSDHDVVPYVKLLKTSTSGKLVLLGITSATGAAMLNPFPSQVVMSSIGGIKATQDVIDLCDKAKIYPTTEIKPVQALNEIYGLLDSGNDKGIRYVLNIKDTLSEKTLTDGSCDNVPPPTLHDFSPPSIGKVFKELVRLWFIGVRSIVSSLQTYIPSKFQITAK
mmetsp:Transcript_36882/g.89461  ORF Transcript_36882/g.89461 Transcript_36882/m.89461 type:complete len:436 (-) Transcript_36882:3795-5102(-)